MPGLFLILIAVLCIVNTFFLFRFSKRFNQLQETAVKFLGYDGRA